VRGELPKVRTVVHQRAILDAQLQKLANCIRVSVSEVASEYSVVDLIR